MRKDMEVGEDGDDRRGCPYCFENGGFDYWSYKEDSSGDPCGDCWATVQENSCLECDETYMWEDEDKLSEEGICRDCSTQGVLKEVLRHTVEVVDSQPTEDL